MIVENWYNATASRHHPMTPTLRDNLLGCQCKMMIVYSPTLNTLAQFIIPGIDDHSNDGNSNASQSAV